MKKSITKAQVIVALKKETLKRGYFFNPGEISKKCTVCAVGAVLRKMSFETWGIKHNMNLHHLGVVATKRQYARRDTLSLVREENYLGALSCYFEEEHTKTQCIAFVKKHFPNKLTIEIVAPAFSG